MILLVPPCKLDGYQNPPPGGFTACSLSVKAKVLAMAPQSLLTCSLSRVTLASSLILQLTGMFPSLGLCPCCRSLCWGCSLPLVLPPIWCCLPVGAPSQLSSGLYQLPPSWWAFPHHCCYITPFLSPRRQSLFLFTILLFSKTLSTFSEAMFFTYLFSFLSTTSIQM